jgi:2,4-dienoyl-CoA reductase-like NADH-dependent reductase (Old Yellow Enzyme family)
VRISANDWVEGGTTPDDAIEIARAFKVAGADMIDVSSARSAGRRSRCTAASFQTPFADRVRNEADIRHDRGRARSPRPITPTAVHRRGPRRPVRVARPHLANPAWTADRGGQDRLPGCGGWPKQYQAGKRAAGAQPGAGLTRRGAGSFSDVAASAGSTEANTCRSASVMPFIAERFIDSAVGSTRAKVSRP